jgi:hypothetical protein
VHEVRFGGNTLGIEACEGVAKELEDKRELRVSRPVHRERGVERWLDAAGPGLGRARVKRKALVGRGYARSATGTGPSSRPSSSMLLALTPSLPFAQIADFSDIFTGRLITEIPQSLRALCTSLLTLPLLTELDLSDNAFGGRSAEPM